MSFESLEDKLKGASNLVDMFRNSPTGFYVFPVPDEHTNWQDEQFAWHNTAVLFDQSYHMTDVYIKGPDRIRLLSDMSINNYENFGLMKAAQFVACTDAGYIIGDAILNEEEVEFGKEVTIGHLMLDTAAQCGALAKVNPPIRPRADVEYLWEMLLDGKLDWVVSDHACCRPGSG